MTRLLERAGVPKEALEIIPDTSCGHMCSLSYMSQPLPQSVPSVNIPDKLMTKWNVT